MAEKKADNRRTRNPRRTFSVKDQLLAKYGPRGYGRLLDQLRKVTG